MTRLTALLTFWLGCLFLLGGCATPRHVAGSVNGSTYTSARGDFSVPFPVSPEVGGRILSDNAQSVTFHDNWGSRITFSSLPFEDSSSMMSVLRAQGPELALREFAKRDYGDAIAVHYHPEACGGAISFLFLKPVGPKTGVAAFVHGHRLYLVETDMLPGVQLLAQGDEKSQLDRDAWLEARTVALAQSMTVK